MKKIFLPLFLIAIIALSCGRKKSEIAVLTERNQQLVSAIEEHEATINELVSFINQLDDNIESLSSQEEKIDQLKIEPALRDSIKEEIRTITTVFKESKQKQQSLQGQLRSFRSRVASLNEKSGELQNEINKREETIGGLNEKFTQLNDNIRNLNLMIADLEGINERQRGDIALKIVELNTAYYTLGDEKELVKGNVIEKKGGFLGLFGRVEKLNPNLNQDKFTRVDIRQKDTIQINEELKNVEIVTVHPKEAYRLEPTADDKTNLVIINPELFWETSKYLVVSKD